MDQGEILLICAIAIFLFQFLVMLLEGRTWLLWQHAILANAFFIASVAMAKTTMLAIVLANPVILTGGIVCLAIGLLAIIRLSVDRNQVQVVDTIMYDTYDEYRVSSFNAARENREWKFKHQ